MKSQTTIEIFLSKFQNLTKIYTNAVNNSETEAKKALYTNLSKALKIICDYNKIS